MSGYTRYEIIELHEIVGNFVSECARFETAGDS